MEFVGFGCFFFFFYFWGEKMNVGRWLVPPADEPTTSPAERAAQR